MNADASLRQVNGTTPTSHTVLGVARCLSRVFILFSCIACGLSGAVFVTGCGNGDDAPRPALGSSDLDGSPGAPSFVAGLGCEEGATESCSLVLGEHQGIVSCYEGTRTCRGGTFSACENGETYEVTREDPAAAGTLRFLAFSAPVDCPNNPCNSYCREFNEVPENGLAPDPDLSAPPLSSWNTGNLSDYPPDWVVVGAREPCQVASDCQFNSACSDPALGSCGHSVCVAGDPLAPGCNRCADAVCAADPDCCGTALACAHDPCEVGSGAPLDRSCDTCVDAVCAAHPECCDVTWNDACVGYVATECAPLGQSCGCPEGSIENGGTCYLAGDRATDWGLARDACSAFGINWTLIQVDNADENAIAAELMAQLGASDAWLGGIETNFDEWTWARSGEVFFISNATGGELQPGYTFVNWASGEPELGSIGRGIAMAADGTWHDEELVLPLDYVCEGTPNQLGPKQVAFTWGQECVDLVATQCGVDCPESVPLGLGSCLARVATELDPDCASFDVALGATCELAGVPQIPVCNHGQVEAPAGLRLVHLPATEIGNAAPDLSGATDCTLSDPIPPGRCIAVTDCPGLTADRALVINPRDGSENASECRLDDNWTIYQPVSCGNPICESQVFDAGQVQRDDCSMPVDNPLNIDTSLALVTLSPEKLEPRCEPGEVRWGSSCYFFSRDVASWDDSQDLCRGRGAGWDLVALNSPAENQWVRSMSDPALDLQIGLNDKAIEGLHVWSNGTCSTYTNWEPTGAEPNNFPPGSEQCVRMTAAAGDQWEDKPCDGAVAPFVCEGPVVDAQGSCSPGQIAGPDGNCYVFDPTLVDFSDAQAACLALGTGWNLAVIDNQTTNEFVSGIVDCNSAWLANPPGALSAWAPAESVNLSNAPYIDALGFWHTAIDGTLRAILCQGPTVAAGAPALTQVDDASDCATGLEYYFEGSAVAPEAIRLCPNACSVASSVAGRRIDVEIPCLPPPPPALETTLSELYTADCEGGSPLWDFFYYDSVTPADSRIDFSIRTAASADDLALGAIPFVPVASAHAIPTDTQRCEVDPSRDCPIDIFTLLGSPAHQQQVLELRVHMVPGTNGEGPLLRDWRVRFSCPPSQ